MHWLKEGDSNTKFFHMSATARRKVKRVEKLRNEEDEIITGQPNLCEVARNYFQELFSPKGGCLDPVLSLISPRVSAEDNAMLEAPITKEEVRIAFFRCILIKPKAQMDLIRHFFNIFGRLVEMICGGQFHYGLRGASFHQV
jgi:hypothetical protein